MEQRIVWQPDALPEEEPRQGKQYQFLTAGEDWVDIDGGKGSGKSDLLIFDCMRNEKLNDPRWLGVIFRREYKRLAELMDRSKYWFSKLPQLGAHWQGEHNRFIFPRGGRFAFHNVENPGDEEKYQGWEICDLKFDQLEEFPETIFDYLLLQNRSGSQVRPNVRWTANPIGEGRCVPFGDVLTSTGWKRIQDIVVGDSVATIDDDGKFIYAFVDQTHVEYFDGELLEHSTATSYLICTPNHKIARGTETKNKNGRTFHKTIVLNRADELPEQSRIITSGEWPGTEIESFELPEYKTRKLRNKQPDSLSGDNYCELMGWFLSEGWTNDRNKCFGICQSKPQNIPIIKDLLDRCGFKYYESTNQPAGNRMARTAFTVHSPRWWNYLKQFGKCTDKFVPEKIKKATKRQLKIFVESAMLGDGDAKWKYYTTSKAFADDMQEIAMKLGYNSYLKSRVRSNRSNRVYEVKFKFSQQAYLIKSKFAKKKYCGDVYCIGIKNLHRFFIRQNGRVWLSGNSWIKRRFIDNKTPGTTYEIQQEVRGVIHTLTYKRIFATVFDNPVLKNDARYIATLANTRSPELRKAFLEGDWNVSVGQFFYDFMDSIHVIPARELPKEWNRLGGLDYGNHKVLTIIAADELGNVYAEYAFHSAPYLDNGRMRAKSAGEFAEDTADWMLTHNIGNGLTVIGDIDLFQMKAKDIGSSKTSVQIIQEVWNKRFKKAGRKPPIIFRVVKKGNENYNYRIACNEAVKEYLAFKTDEFYNVTQQPRLFILDRVSGLRTTLPELVGDPDDPMDFIQYKGEAKNDHDFDSFKMPFMQIYQTKELMKAADEDESDWYKQLYGHLTTRALKNPLKPSGRYRR